MEPLSIEHVDIDLDPRESSSVRPARWALQGADLLSPPALESGSPSGWRTRVGSTMRPWRGSLGLVGTFRVGQRSREFVGGQRREAALVDEDHSSGGPTDMK